MKMKTCVKCGSEFQIKYRHEGKVINGNNRTKCIICSPVRSLGDAKNKLFNTKLTDIQEQILIGHLLGDGCLGVYKERKNAYFELKRKHEDLEYLRWTYKNFEYFATGAGIIDTKSFSSDKSKIYKGNSFRTKTLPIFEEYRNKWYPEGKKIIPKDLILTPLIIAVWFADDGCVSRQSSITLRTQISTNSFSYEEVVFLKKQLVSLCGANFNIYKITNKEQYTICTTNTSDSKKLFRIIDYDFPLDRKSKIWRTDSMDLWDRNVIFNPICSFCGSNNTIKHGKSKLKDYEKQKYYCKDCQKDYLDLKDYDRRYMPKQIRESLSSTI